MKKAAFILLVIFLFAATHSSAQLGGRYHGAACPFESEAELWNEELGTLFAEELRKRIRLHQVASFMPVEEVQEVLDKTGIGNARDAGVRELRNAFWRKNVRFLIVGKIESVYFIRDVDGTAYADVEISYSVIDLLEEAGAFSNRISYRTKPSKYATSETPYDKKIALSFLNGGANRISEQIRTGLRSYLDRMPRIF